METHQGMTITFRTDYIDQQLQRLQQIVDYADKQGRPLQTVDLTPDVNVPHHLRSKPVGHPTHHYVLGKITQYCRRT